MVAPYNFHGLEEVTKSRMASTSPRTRPILKRQNATDAMADVESDDDLPELLDVGAPDLFEEHPDGFPGFDPDSSDDEEEEDFATLFQASKDRTPNRPFQEGWRGAFGLPETVEGAPPSAEPLAGDVVPPPVVDDHLENIFSKSVLGEMPVAGEVDPGSTSHASPDWSNCQGRVYWFVTNASGPVEGHLRGKDIRFSCGQQERSESGYLHWQGFFELHKKSKFGKVLFTKCGMYEEEGKSYRCGITKGSQETNIAYTCSKYFCRQCHTGDYLGLTELVRKQLKVKPFDPEQHVGHRGFGLKGQVEGTTWTHGTPIQHPGRQGCKIGKDSDDVQAKCLNLIKAGESLQSIYETFPAFSSRCHAWLQKSYTMFAPNKRGKTCVVALYGGPGTHKTRIANSISSNTFSKLPDTHWFDGLSPLHDVLSYEDIRASSMTFTSLLRMLDRYPLLCEVKGGSVWLQVPMIVLTMPTAPSELWATIAGEQNERLGQLLRRIDLTINMDLLNESGKVALLKDLRKRLHDCKTATVPVDPIYGSIWDGKGTPPSTPPVVEDDMSDCDMNAADDEADDGTLSVSQLDEDVNMSPPSFPISPDHDWQKPCHEYSLDENGSGISTPGVSSGAGSYDSTGQGDPSPDEQSNPDLDTPN